MPSESDQGSGPTAELRPVAPASLATAMTPAAYEGPGTKIGVYKILQTIGEGGFGSVFMAEQQHPVNRKVALKIIKLGMDTKQVIARFEAERQALAMMDHPNIAKVLDAGATDIGRPYFVMELVKGVPVTEYCDSNKLSTRQRLDLFISICRAVQHAHQKGIIHRDIKPNNILITLHDGVPVPKVIDFGIAKATQARLTEKTLFTEYRQLVGTPEYMSPEQAEMSELDVDTRSDIYSLGVLLYELLTGTTPFDPKKLRTVGYEAMQRIIREEEPPKPSTRLSTMGQTLSTVAAQHRTDPRRLRQEIRGELDWIVMRCLEKDRTRRYDTANALADDIQRFMRSEPVQARPSSAAYRLRKFVHRHRMGVSAGAVIALLLILGAVGTGIGLLRTRWALDLARQENEKVLKAEAATRRERDAAMRAQQEAEASQARAVAGEMASRRHAYVADMSVIQQALEDGDIGHARLLLDRNRPAPAQPDFRGWEWRYRWSQVQKDPAFIRELTSYSDSVKHLSASSDGRVLAVGAADGMVGIVELSSGRFQKLQTRCYGAAALVFAPGSSVLAFVGDDGEGKGRIRLVDVAAEKELEPIRDSGRIYRMTFSSDGKLLAVFATQGFVKIWRLADRQLLNSFDGGSPSSMHHHPLAFSPTESLLAFGRSDGRVALVEVATGKYRLNYHAHAEGITALAFSPDGATLATAAGFSDSSVKLWNAKTGQQLGPPLLGHRRFIHALAFSPTGEFLASGSADQSIRLWDVKGGKQAHILRGHGQEVWALAFIPGQPMLASACKDGSVWAWSISPDSLPHLAGLTVSPLPSSFMIHPSFLNSAEHVQFSIAGGPSSLIFHPSTFNLAGRIASFAAQHSAYIVSAIEVRRFCYLGPDDALAVITGPLGSTRIWDAREMKEKAVLGGQGILNTAIACSPDGSRLAIGDSKGQIAIWNMAGTPQILRILDAEQSPCSFLRFSADGSKLLSISGTGCEQVLWDLPSFKPLAAWHTADPPISADLSPDARLAVSGHRDGSFSVWNIERNSLQTTGRHHGDACRVAFSPDGATLATATEYGTLMLWDTATWKPQGLPLRGHLLGIHSLAFSPDGQRLATGSGSDEAVIVWDLAMRRAVATLSGEGTVFSNLAFSRDGNSIAATNSMGQLHIWRAPSWADIEAAEKAQVRSNRTEE